VEDLVEYQDGVVSVRQALRFVSRGVIRSAVESGRWQRVHRGVLVTHSGQLTADQRLWVASLAAGNGEPAPLGGLSALRAHGLRGFEPAAIAVLLPAHREHRTPPPGVVVHRTTTLSARDVYRPGRPPRTRPARSIVDAAAWARTDREAKGIIAASFQQRIVRLGDMMDALARAPRARRRQLTTRTARDAAAGATSLGELDLLDVIRRAGLPEPKRQHPRRDAAGRRRYLDFYYPEWGIHIEVDGAHHLNPLEAWDDMARQNALWTRGDRVLRFPAWMVRDRPETVAAQIRDALRAAGWGGC
jgi:very-short-patch-repair endonuclease